MAGSEGQTELLTGWSCVVHRPSEDPEPSSLPSTVDITASSSGPVQAPSNTPQNDCCSNSDSDSGSDSENSVSDASGSCSYSSSDTDSSSSSQVSTSSSVPPQFSVTSSQTGGLRLTIATVRKSCSSPTQKDDSNQQATTEKDEQLPQHQATAKDPENSINSVVKNLPNPKLSSSDSDSDSDSETSSNSESRLTVKSNASDKKQMVKRDSPAGRAKCLRKTSKSLIVKQSESKTNCAKRTVRNKDGNLKGSPRCLPKNRGRSTRNNKVDLHFEMISKRYYGFNNCDSAAKKNYIKKKISSQFDIKKNKL